MNGSSIGLIIACCLWGTLLGGAQPQSYTFTTIAGQPGFVSDYGADGTNTAAHLNGPYSLALDRSGNLYVADCGNNTVRKLTRMGTNWAVTSPVGPAAMSGSADGTNGQARFSKPYGIATDNTNLYVADSFNNTIRKATPDGTNWVVTTLAGRPSFMEQGTADGTNSDARFHTPMSLAVDPTGTLYVADTWNHTIRQVKPTGTNWVVSTIAGQPHFSGSADGTNGAAQFCFPEAIAVDSATNLYVADSGNAIIRRITPLGTNWVVSTLAGLAFYSGNTDGLNQAARFDYPTGIAVDGAGNLYVADWGNQNVRKLTPCGTNWVVSTLAGQPGSSASADGTGTNASFASPSGIAADSAGNLFVADFSDNLIRWGRLPPSLQLTRCGNQVVLSWPSTVPDFLLETASTLSADSSWQLVTQAPDLSDKGFVLTNKLDVPSAFYRLRKQ